MRTVTLSGTTIETSALGFGCAGLFRLPKSRDRRALLETAFEAGIRHYDVAPMYGLGMAEPELAAFMHGRRDEITVTTKFGIEPSAIGRVAARVQGPARLLLERRGSLREGVRAAARGPNAGPLGRIVYRSPGFGARSAELSLNRSLKALGTGYVDIFVLHEPQRHLISDLPALVARLEEQRRRGQIRCWGVAGDVRGAGSWDADLVDEAPLVQFREDIFDWDQPAVTTKATITYGAIERVLPILRRFLAEFPDQVARWSERLEFDLASPDGLPTLLISVSLFRNVGGPVLFSSTRPERVRVAARASTAWPTSSGSGQLSAIRELAAEVIDTYPSVLRAS